MPGIHLRVDGYPSAPVMSPCRRTHWDGKGQRSQSSWTLQMCLVSFIQCCESSPILYKKPDFQFLLQNQNTWQDRPESPPQRHLEGTYSPVNEEVPLPAPQSPPLPTAFHQLLKHRCRACALNLAGRMTARPGLIKQPQLTFPFNPHSNTWSHVSQHRSCSVMTPASLHPSPAPSLSFHFLAVLAPTEL